MIEGNMSFRPRTVGKILDDTFRVYRNNFIVIMGFSALISGLFNLFVLFVTHVLAPPGAITDPWSLIIQGIKSGNFEDFILQTPAPKVGPDYLVRTMLMSGVTGILGIAGYLFVEPFVQGGIINITVQYFHGKTLDLSSSFQMTRRKFGRLIATAFCLFIYYIGVLAAFFIVCLLFLVPLAVMGIFSPGGLSGAAVAGVITLLIFFIVVLIALAVTSSTFIAFVYPIVMVEDNFHFRAIGRSFALVSKKFWRVFGVNFLVALLVYTIITAIGAVAFILSIALPVPPMFQQVLTMIITVLGVPITYIASTILYYDVRIRVEGYDLEMLTENMEGNDPWVQTDS